MANPWASMVGNAAFGKPQQQAMAKRTPMVGAPAQRGGGGYGRFDTNGDPVGGYQDRPQLDPNEVQGQAPGGVNPITDRYDDSYGAILDALRGGKPGDQLFQDLLGGFRGKIGDLQKFMDTPAYRNALAFSLKNMPEYERLRTLQDPTMQQLSTGLGQISRAGGEAVASGLRGLNAGGMGRNAGAAAAIQRAGQLETGSRGAQYGNAIRQQAYGNEMNRLSMLLGLEQSMQSLALGGGPAQRGGGNSGPGTGDWLALAGTLVGSAFGSPWLGGVIGGTAGKK